MPEQRDRDAEKGEEWEWVGGCWNPLRDQCTVVTGKTKLETEQCCIVRYSQQGHILDDNDESNDDVI